jgi:soluble P-type ATPase
MAKTALKMEEEELDIETEIAVADAKSKVYDHLEQAGEIKPLQSQFQYLTLLLPSLELFLPFLSRVSFSWLVFLLLIQFFFLLLLTVWMKLMTGCHFSQICSALKMEEEELDIETEIAVADAKSKVYDHLEQAGEINITPVKVEFETELIIASIHVA